jgi:hypothetical protein
LEILIQATKMANSLSSCRKKPQLVLPRGGFFVGRARFFARHDVFNIVFFGVQNSEHTLQLVTCFTFICKFINTTSRLEKISHQGHFRLQDEYKWVTSQFFPNIG